ncbi:DHA2 family efflux MFS transporter permease subunit [Frigoriglobus tundricola]|uniref:Inner-membrane proton/drug antiporter (MSF type) of tripartite multidrug efflux system n=1 Tax=Frigoriglobus tundricola TaxID=2774151 RepID=A0A6M5Z3I4_9BACT|nr:DHA2 family efflux MFS transporter permease subunit [Frigoriglobus tundricola]QJX00317.1 Inner-membrane proton/drug antiporter (MSF type) of tripartite multidrug efflux system [Frigoriglobus tundricola]
MSSGVGSATTNRPAVNPWLVAVAVVIPTFMEILDTTIANVALRYIAGGLSAANIDSEWVITSYLAANATILPISGWISAHIGRKNYFLLSILVFSISSALCGLATNLGQLILFRVVQGLAGGGLQPSSQSILLDSFPPEKQGAAQTLFGIAALVGPIVGPTLGGYLTDNYSWRWIFYINAPVGVAALVACYFLLDDPPYLRAEREQLKKKPLNFDFIGLGLLVVVMSAWEIMLSKGQEWNWWEDPFGRVQTLQILFGVCLLALVVRELRSANPVVNFRPLTDRNFVVCCLTIFCLYGTLYASSTILPALLQTLFRYDAFHSGLVMSPSGVFAILTMIVVSLLMTRGLDTRWLIGVGLVVSAAGQYWMSVATLDISPWFVALPRVVMIIGLSMTFSPLQVTAFKYIPQHLRGAAVGLFSLLRNEGGSAGTSIAQTVQERRLQFHLSRLDDHLTAYDKPVRTFLSQMEAYFFQMTGDPALAHQRAVKALDTLRQQQAGSLAYFDVFFLSAVITAALVVFVFLLKPSKAEAGAPVGE